MFWVVLPTASSSVSAVVSAGEVRCSLARPCFVCEPCDRLTTSPGCNLPLSHSSMLGKASPPHTGQSRARSDEREVLSALKAQKKKQCAF